MLDALGKFPPHILSEIVQVCERVRNKMRKLCDVAFEFCDLGLVVHVEKCSPK